VNVGANLLLNTYTSGFEITADDRNQPVVDSHSLHRLLGAASQLQRTAYENSQ